MKRALTLAFLALCACGGSSDNLNSAIGRTWTGTTTFSVNGQNQGNSAGQLTVTVSGKTANVTNVCKDGSVTITARGSGNSATWSGVVTCTDQVNCGTLTLIYNSATLDLSSDNKTLTADASGTVTGCNWSNAAFAIHFVGT